jgi:hypothetical protein
MDHRTATIAAYPDQPISRFKLFLRRLIIVDQGKPSAPSPTKLSPKAERDHPVLVGLVKGSEFL